MAGYTPARVAVFGSRLTGVGARECRASANRAERALVHRSGVDAAHDDLEALRLQLADRGIDGRWAGRGGGSGSSQSERGGSQRARCEGADEDLLNFVPFFVKIQFAM